MKYHGIWSSAWVFYLTTALLLTAVVLRSILVYGSSPVLPQALFALLAWSVLFITEREISRRLTNYFTFYLFFQTALTFFLFCAVNTISVGQFREALFYLACAVVGGYFLLTWGITEFGSRDGATRTRLPPPAPPVRT